MTFKKRNQDNIVPFAKGVENQQQLQAQARIKKLIASIDYKMQQSFWDAVAFDDQELELLSNFGETIKFAHDNTAVSALSILSTYILRKRNLEEFIDV